MAEYDKANRPVARIQVQLDDEVAQGKYANFVMINNSDTEFTLDFIYIQPHQPRAKVRARMILSPKRAKQMLMALEENLRRYEQHYGKVDIGGLADEEPPILN